MAGGSAFTEARQQKKLTLIRRANPGIRALNASFDHFIDVEGKLTPDEIKRARASAALRAAADVGQRRARHGRVRAAHAGGPAPRHRVAVVVEGNRHRAQLRAGEGRAHRARHPLRHRRRGGGRGGAAARDSRSHDRVGPRPLRRAPRSCSSTRRRARWRASRWRRAGARARRARERDAGPGAVARRDRLPGRRASASSGATRPTSN